MCLLHLGYDFWDLLEDFGQNIRKNMAMLIKTPNSKNSLWFFRPLDHYKDDMFIIDVENEIYFLKPMDCLLIFKF